MAENETRKKRKEIHTKSKMKEVVDENTKSRKKKAFEKDMRNSTRNNDRNAK